MGFLRTEVDSEIHLHLARTGVSVNHNESVYSKDYESILKITEQSYVCFFCKKPGHTKQNCRHYKQWISKQARKNDCVSNENSKKDEPSKLKPESVNIIQENGMVTDFLF